MNRADAIHALPSEFNGFLSAPIFEEKSGMLLSVLSALARLNIDPWQEADELSHMPMADATRRLSSIIAALPGRTAVTGSSESIACRLISLLPRSPASSASSHSPPVGGDEGMKSKAPVVYVVVMILAMSVQLLMASRQAPSQIEHSSTQGSSAGTVSHQEQPPKSGQ